MPTQAEIVQALGLGAPAGPQLPPTGAPQVSSWGGAPQLMQMLSQIPMASPAPLGVPGFLKNLSMPSMTASNPWDMVGGGNVPGPAWAERFNGPNPINFDAPFGIDSLPSPAVPAQVATGMANPLMGIIKGLQGADSIFGGSKEAEAQVPGLPPLDFGSYSIPPQPKDATGASPPAVIEVPFDINSMPRPPLLDAPPEIDMEKIQGANTSNILGALASGAAQVDATEAGSFAKALASAGGMGASAAGKGKAVGAEVEYKNALNAYNTTMQNQQTQYEYEGKKWEMMLPTMKATDDSVVVQEFKDGKYQVRVIKTGGLLGDADELKKTIEAMGGDGQLAESLEVQFLAKSVGNDPVALQTNLTRLAIERTIRNGAGPTVFGDKYKSAAEAATAEVPVGLMTDPEEYQKYFSRAVSAKLLSDPELMKEQSWMNEAAKYGSISAGILTNGR